jgi:uncharacterized membrane protein
MYGVLRVIIGVEFLQRVGQPLSEFLYTLMSHELTGKTGDAVLEKIYTVFETHDFTVTYFIASYFIFWGVVDIVLSGCLLKHIHKAFPITMLLIAFFIAYGLFRFTFTHSIVLLSIICIDLLILFLVNIEYKKLKASYLR